MPLEPHTGAWFDDASPLPPGLFSRPRVPRGAPEPARNVFNDTGDPLAWCSSFDVPPVHVPFRIARRHAGGTVPDRQAFQEETAAVLLPAWGHAVGGNGSGPGTARQLLPGSLASGSQARAHDSQAFMTPWPMLDVPALVPMYTQAAERPIVRPTSLVWTTGSVWTDWHTSFLLWAGQDLPAPRRAAPPTRTEGQAQYLGTITDDMTVLIHQLTPQLPGQLPRRAFRPDAQPADTPLPFVIEQAAWLAWVAPWVRPRTPARPVQDGQGLAALPVIVDPAEATNRAWDVPPQQPVPPRRQTRTDAPAWSGWFDVLAVDNLKAWSQQPPAMPRRPARFVALPMPPDALQADDPAPLQWMAQAQQPARLLRGTPGAPIGDTAAPLALAAGLIIVAGPYWTVAAQISVAGVVVGMIQRE